MTSTESISPPPWINMRTGSRYVLTNTVENSGHMIWMLCSAAFLFSELNKLLASTRITSSVLSFVNINFIERIAAFSPPCKPVAVWRGPPVCWMSLRNNQPVHFPLNSSGNLTYAYGTHSRDFTNWYESIRYKCYKSVRSKILCS